MKKNFLFLVLALVALTTALPLRAQMRIYRDNSQIARQNANVFFNTDGSGNWSVVNTQSGAYNANMDLSQIDSISVVDNVIHVTGVTLAPAKVYMNEGGRAQITATILPKNATYQSISFKTSNPGVVAIKGDSLFAVSPGEAIITATTAGDGSFTATCYVEVSISIPDPAFYNYCVGQFDEDQNGGLSVEEAEAATKINCGKLDIRSMKGLEWFTNLTELNIDGAANLTSIDVSKNTALTKLTILNGGLESLNVRMLKNLKFLACSNTEITSLNVSENTELTDLLCNMDRLSVLNVSNNPKLTRLLCSDNMLVTLDLSHNTALSNLVCYNNRIAMLDLSNNKALTGAWVGNQTDSWGNGQYVDIDVIAPSGINTSSVFPYLNSGSEDPHEDEYGNSRVNFTSFINIPDATFRAYCLSNFDTNKDGKISLSEAAAAKTVNVAGTAVASLEGIQYFTNITLLECSSCNLEGTLDVSMLMKMEYCQCSNNKLTKLILPENSALIRLQCDRNRISSIDVQRCFKLGAAWVGAQTSDGTTGIYIKVYLEDAFTSVLKDNIFPLLNDADGYNARVAIPVIFRDDNFEAYCLSNFDTNKDGVVSREEAKAVTEISCPGSKIRNLDGIEWFTNLVNLHVQKNRISSLYLNDFKKLKFVEAGDMMSLTYVSVSGCSSLYYLSIYSCSISSVNLKGCSALSELYCYDNRLQSIDLNGINALTEAYVGAQSADGSKLHSVILYNTTLAESVFPKFDVAGYTNMLVVFDGRNIPFTKTNKGVQDWLIAAGYDKDGDGKISYYEASLADSLSGVGTSDMAALSGNGFKYLCNLRYLWNNQINDGTDWKYFKQFSMDIACGRRTIEMDLSNNLLLEYLNLSPATYVYYNGKKDFYKITGGVTKLAVPYSLKSLSVSGCSLKALDLANCTKLEFLNCGYNSISQLYVWNSYRLQRAVVGHQRYTATSGDYEELPIMLEVYIPKGWTDERIQSVFAIDPTDLKQNIQIHPSY